MRPEEDLVATLDLEHVDDPAGPLARLAPDGSGRPLREVAFLVLDEEGHLDRAATRTVLEVLGRREATGPDEVRDPATGRVFVVHRADELPRAIPFVDPLCPGSELRQGVSVPYDVVVRPRLSEERHQLLLFLRLREVIPPPRNHAAAEALVTAFATLELGELLARHGGRGAYEKAARRPEGLPSIVRTGRESDLSQRIRGAFERLDAFLRGRGVLAGFEGAGPPVGTLSAFAGALARRLSVSVLHAVLRDAGVAAPLPSSRSADYATALVGAFRDRLVSLDTLLRRTEPALLAELADALGSPDPGREDVATILSALETLERDGVLRAAPRVALISARP